MIWEQKLDELAAHIRELETNLADVDRLVSAHQHLIDPNPRTQWPKGSILGKAVDRHAARVLREEMAKAACDTFDRLQNEPSQLP